MDLGAEEQGDNIWLECLMYVLPEAPTADVRRIRGLRWSGTEESLVTMLLQSRCASKMADGGPLLASASHAYSVKFYLFS